MRVYLEPYLDAVGRFGGHENNTATIQEMNDEPSLFSCSPEWVLENGGDYARIVTKMILATNHYRVYSRALTDYHPVIDVRVQRLMPGMYPSIPGWHCDSVPRDDYHSQPDFSKVDPRVIHFSYIIGTEPDGISRTEYFLPNFTFNLDPKNVYKSLHSSIERLYTTNTAVDPGKIYAFNSMTPHRAMPATTRGWRMFYRLSFMPNPPIGNRTTNMNQVYILSEENGW